MDEDDDYYTQYEVDISSAERVSVTMDDYDGGSYSGYDDYDDEYGYEEGYNKGFADGYKEGYTEAFRDAYQMGFQAGLETDKPAPAREPGVKFTF